MGGGSPTRDHWRRSLRRRRRCLPRHSSLPHPLVWERPPRRPDGAACRSPRRLAEGPGQLPPRRSRSTMIHHVLR